MGILSDLDLKKLVLRIVESSSPEGVPEDDVHVLIKWAERARLAYSTLDMVLSGELDVRLVDGEPSFRKRDSTEPTVADLYDASTQL
jgi:hypothetical protein